MESLQPSPPFQRNDELSCSWNLYPAQGPCHSLGAGRGHLQHGGILCVELPRALGSLWCWGDLPFPAFLSNPQVLLSLYSSLTGVSQPPRLVWNLGKSGVILSEFQFSLILWRRVALNFWVTQAWATLAGCTLTIKQLSCFTLHTSSTHCAKTNFFCPSIWVHFLSVKA